MIGPRPVHDRAILDALEAIDPEAFAGEVRRVIRKGRVHCAVLVFWN